MTTFTSAKTRQISTYIITTALDNVHAWSKTQNTTPEDSLTIKTNYRTHEITASKDIDDQSLSILIKLPKNFPLGQATVEGINRVGVSEDKWRTWLLNTQGVIAFSDGSLVEGLVAFRKNVIGQMKGQTECAICYSIVSQDRQLPTKKCGTC